MAKTPDGTENKRQDYRTPQDIFDKLHAEFVFTIDGFANAHNSLLARFCSSEGFFDLISKSFFPLDGLDYPWDNERVFANPPYTAGFIQKVVDKALLRQAEISCLLLPCNTDTQWYHDLCREMNKHNPKLEYDEYSHTEITTGNGIEMRKPQGRIKFLLPHGIPDPNPPGANLIVIVQKDK